VFNSLTGRVSFKDNESICLSTGGIEWELKTTLQSLKEFPAPGGRATAYVFLYHREDQMKLYGFSGREERSLFLNLIKVDGLGPKLAIKILSAISAAALVTALENEDINTLSSLPGLGKKTAQKVILTLQGKLKRIGLQDQDTGLNEDIINALVGMGFDKRISREAVGSALKELLPREIPTEELDKELFTKALAIASRMKG
jgi:Holliday junction DNA helicase RuvA